MLGGEGSAALLKVEQTDLINYGLIPEFVGRFPVISTLQARPAQSRALPGARLSNSGLTIFLCMVLQAGVARRMHHRQNSISSYESMSFSWVLLPGLCSMNIHQVKVLGCLECRC